MLCALQIAFVDAIEQRSAVTTCGCIIAATYQLQHIRMKGDSVLHPPGTHRCASWVGEASFDLANSIICRAHRVQVLGLGDMMLIQERHVSKVISWMGLPVILKQNDPATKGLHALLAQTLSVLGWNLVRSHVVVNSLDPSTQNTVQIFWLDTILSR